MRWQLRSLWISALVNGRVSRQSWRMGENVLWKGSSSHVLNFGVYLAGLLLFVGLGIAGTFFPLIWVAVIFPLIWMLWKFLFVRCRVYELSDQRLRDLKRVREVDFEEGGEGDDFVMQ